LDLITLTGGLSVIGRTVVLHLTIDDCVNVASASSRIAHCVIGIGNPAYFPPSFAIDTIITSNNIANNCMLIFQVQMLP
jgi:hypothetical protein